VASGGDCRAVDFEAPGERGAPDVDDALGVREEPPAFVEFPALGKLAGGLEEACRPHPDSVNTATSQIPQIPVVKPAGKSVRETNERDQQGVDQPLLIGPPASILIPHFSGIIGRDFGD
jgi:hypothetical protein